MHLHTTDIVHTRIHNIIKEKLMKSPPTTPAKNTGHAQNYSRVIKPYLLVQTLQTSSVEGNWPPLRETPITEMHADMTSLLCWLPLSAPVWFVLAGQPFPRGFLAIRRSFGLGFAPCLRERVRGKGRSAGCAVRGQTRLGPLTTTPSMALVSIVPVLHRRLLTVP